MRAVDTNVLVRLFAQDNAEQVELAQQAVAADTVFIPKSVILEFEWVMRSLYGQSRAALASAIETILETANVEVEDAAAVAGAVTWLHQGLDFADALHLASSGHVDQFVTFDSALRRRATALAAKPTVVAP